MPRKHCILTSFSALTRSQSERDGWYHNGTWAKAKIIMKAKIAAILDGVPPNDAAFAKVIGEMPEIMRSNNRAATYLASDATPEEIHLASVIRTTALMHYSSNQDGTRANDGYDDEPHQDEIDEGITMPAAPENYLIDPRITGAVSQFAGLDAEAEYNETTGEGMDIDDAQDSSD